MICHCGKPRGHTGRHVIHQTERARCFAHRLQQAAWVNTRYWQRRAREVCVDCERYSPQHARCLACRRKVAERRTA